MFEKSLKLGFVVLVVISIAILSLALNTLVQTGLTSSICSDESPAVSERSVFLNGSTTLLSVVKIYNNGTLPLEFLSGPVIIVYSGNNNASTTSYTLNKSIPHLILPGKSATAYVNITIPYYGRVAYYLQIDYYVGNWKPNPYLVDYSYVRYYSGVHFEWQG